MVEETVSRRLLEGFVTSWGRSCGFGGRLFAVDSPT